MTEEPGPIILTDTHRRQIVAAGRRMRSIRRAISFARFSAGTTMLFGVLSLMFSSVGLAMGQPPGVGLIVGIGLVAVAANEYRGAVLLGRLHHGAPIRLALGQVVLGSMIIGYCLWAIIHTETSAALSDPQLQEILADYEGLLKGMTALVYGAVMAATVLFQGLAALYYLTRGKQILNYVSQTPNWIVEIDRLRAGG